MAWIVLIALLCLSLYLYFRFFKIPKIKNILFVDGSLGSGKSFYSVSVAIRLYKRSVRQYRIRKFLLRLIEPLGNFDYFSRLKGAWSKLEEPLLYSNIPLRRVKHCPLTLDILLRKVRIPFKSVILIDEMSLIVDQFDYKDREVSEALRDFFKLYRHETHGGHIVINSQSTADLHYSLKSVLSDYLYIHHKVRLPFFSVLKCQEMAYSSDKDGASIVNAHIDDVETNLRMVFCFNKYFKSYDTYCFSILTDGLPVFDDWFIIDKKESAKTKEVLTFKKGRYKVVSNVEVNSDVPKSKE